MRTNNYTINEAIEKLCYYHSSLNIISGEWWIAGKIAFKSLARLYLMTKKKKDWFGKKLNKKEKKKLLAFCRKYIDNEKKKIKRIIKK